RTPRLELPSTGEWSGWCIMPIARRSAEEYPGATRVSISTHPLCVHICRRTPPCGAGGHQDPAYHAHLYGSPRGVIQPMLRAQPMEAHPTTGGVLARPSTSLAPRLVILGGGFAGVTTALELAKRCAGVLPVDITLVSEQNFFLFTPMLAEAATG